MTSLGYRKRVVHEAILNMRCDGLLSLQCPHEPIWAPRVAVPSKEHSIKPLRMMTTLHYCELHRGVFDINEFLTDKIKARFEAVAKSNRGEDFKCDFERAYIERIRIRTPEYRAFLGSLMGLAA